MNKKLIWGVIVSVIIVGGVIYFYNILFQGKDTLMVLPQGQNHLIKVDTTDWRTYSISEVGITFKYPAYFGNVIVSKTDRKSCPEMKMYQAPESLPSQDYVVSFSNSPKIGVGGSSVEARISIANTENNTNYCGLDIAALDVKMSSNSNYQKLNSGRVNLKEEYASSIYTTIGTSAQQLYSLLFTKRNIMTLVQPTITFIPWAYSDEAKEIGLTGTGVGDIVNYVKNAKNAEQIRSYFRDFEALQATIQITN